MKPNHSILGNSFRYVPVMATLVSDTWSRFGWRPTSQERRQPVAATAQPVADAAAVVWTGERSASGGLAAILSTTAESSVASAT